MPNVNIDSQTVQYDHDPDLCPICHHAVSPRILVAPTNENPLTINSVVNIAFKCTHRECMNMFIGIYERTNPSEACYNFIRATPLSFESPTVFPEVAKLSPSFETINNQAHAAESYNLEEIAGVGYRKALEFLIKDFCIYKNPDKEDEIKNKFLGAVIKDYVDDTNIKVCAERAVWIGNDETHYVRKWENKDIKDLKLLIELTSGWVRSNLLTEKYMAEMNN